MIKMSFLRKYKTDLLVVLFFLLFLPLFFYNLGSFGLTDFDEGWFAEVARNILVNRDPIILTFNGTPFTEHPPLGYDLIAFSFLLFGINEFAARFPSAILGWGCLILTYLLGKNLFNRWIGLGSSLMLASSVWFIFRARSGNLDTIFLFFYLLTFYTAVKVKKNPKWIYGLAISAAAVFMVKSMIGLSILVPVFVFFLVEKMKMPLKKIILALLVFLLVVFPWVIKNFQAYGWEYFLHIVKVGLRVGFRIMPNFADLGNQITFQYLHFGIGKWYQAGIVAFVGLLPLIKKIKALMPIYALLIFLLIGFMTNSKTEIWHLIPIYPFWGILIAVFGYFYSHYLLSSPRGSLFSHPRGGLKALQEKIGYSSRRGTYNKFTFQARTITSFLVIIPMFTLSLYQIYQFRYGVKLFDHGLGGLATVSAKAKDLKEDLYLDGHDFLPSAVFYSQKKVQHIRGLPPPRNLLKGFISEASPSSLLLTQKWRLEMDKIDPTLYETLAQKEDWMLVKVVK